MNAPPKFRPLVNTIGTILPVIAAYGVYVLCVMYSFAVVGLSLFFGLLRRDNATLADTAWAAGVYHFPVDDAFGRARCGGGANASAAAAAGDDCVAAADDAAAALGGEGGGYYPLNFNSLEHAILTLFSVLAARERERGR